MNNIKSCAAKVMFCKQEAGAFEMLHCVDPFTET